jgi:hypothetical protein
MRLYQKLKILRRLLRHPKKHVVNLPDVKPVEYFKINMFEDIIDPVEIIKKPKPKSKSVLA